MRKNLKVYFALALFIMALPAIFFPKADAWAKQDTPHLLFFYSQNCHACHKVMHEVMPEIEREFFDRIIIERFNTNEESSYRLLLALRKEYKTDERGVPAVFIGDKALTGYWQIKEGLRSAIEEALEKAEFSKFDKLPGIDLAKHFLSFGVLTIILAGLIDGVNPCAFTVIVFFLSFLAVQGYRRRELIAIGTSFIFAVFLTYVLVGLGIFRFLYMLRHFYIITKAIYYAVAAFCFILGAFALYDFWLFKKTGKTEGMALQLPQRIKNLIHSTIGSHYRIKERNVPNREAKKNLIALIGSALLSGFLVSLLEGVCTGQVYLPTITLVLKDVSLRARAFMYLLLYNFMFIAPLVVIMGFSLLGTSSEKFATLIKTNISAIKLAIAVLFLGLGAMILIGA